MTDLFNQKPPMRQWENTKTFYKALEDRSDPYMHEGEELRRFEGAITNLFKEVCPTGLYGQVKRNLDKLGCIEVTRRGGGREGASVCVLLQDPETGLAAQVSVTHIQSALRADTEAGKLAALNRRVHYLESAVTQLHRRLQVLEGEEPKKPYEPTPRIDPRLKELVNLADELEERDG